MDDRLKALRKEIEETDRLMAELFVRRMETADKIAAYKRENGIPVSDPARESENISRNLAYIDNENLKEYYIDFLKNTMALSRSYQKKLNGEDNNDA